jgi:hypothetical protein
LEADLEKQDSKARTISPVLASTSTLKKAPEPQPPSPEVGPSPSLVDPDTTFLMSPSSKAQWYHEFLNTGFSRAYLDAAHKIVLAFKRCNYQVVRRLLPNPKHLEVKDSTMAGSVSLVVFGFPSCHKDRVYTEEDCLQCVHDSGPADVANNLFKFREQNF